MSPRWRRPGATRGRLGFTSPQLASEALTRVRCALVAEQDANVLNPAPVIPSFRASLADLLPYNTRANIAWTRAGWQGSKEGEVETEVVVALVSSFVSVVIASGTALWTGKENERTRKHEADLSNRQKQSESDLELLKADLQERARQEEVRAQKATEFALYKDPLLNTAYELWSRIDNIKTGGFLAYLNGSRHDAAIRTTLYRLARYFGMLEILYARLNYLRFEKSEDTAAAAKLLAEIGKTFASDGYDRINGFETSRFMIWREEQRAMGETVIRSTSKDEWELIGYAAFGERLDSGASRWFERFVADVEQGDMATSQRIQKLHSLLLRLVRRLDTERRFPDVGSTS